MKRLIDLSIALRSEASSEPPHMRQRISYTGHREGAQEFVDLFPGLQASQLPDSEGPALDWLELSTHNGTHLDAPWHMHSTMDNGKPAYTIDVVPLDWCFSSAVKLDFREKPDGFLCGASDVERELDRIGYELKPLDIVLVNTSASNRHFDADYREHGCGFGREATLFLLEKGVRVTGTDAWSWDAPFSQTRKRYLADRDPGIIWEGHKVSREIGYCHMEKLTNLELLPAHGFSVVCFPVKIEGGSAGWTRAVAILEE